MLVLTRKPGEKIIVGNALRVEVISVEHGVVKLSFEADQPVTLMPGNVQIEAGDADESGKLLPIKVTRKVDDSVIIGEDEERRVEVLVVSVRGDAVRIGVKAPRDVQVHRQEVFELIEQENIAAAKATAVDPKQIKKLLESRRDLTEPADDPGEEGGA
ncbi:carbon storage regulator [bacterium]|nr:carbon storage regulator [bacterium]